MSPIYPVMEGAGRIPRSLAGPLQSVVAKSIILLFRTEWARLNSQTSNIRKARQKTFLAEIFLGGPKHFFSYHILFTYFTLNHSLVTDKQTD